MASKKEYRAMEISPSKLKEGKKTIAIIRRFVEQDGSIGWYVYPVKPKAGRKGREKS